MNNRAKEYLLLIEEIIEADKAFKAHGLDLIKPDEWQQFYKIVANVLKNLEPREPGMS
jgi:hypothetical protein